MSASQSVSTLAVVTALVGFEDYYIRLETIAASAEYILENKPLFGP